MRRRLISLSRRGFSARGSAWGSGAEMAARLLAFRRAEGVVTEMSDEALLAACAVGDTAALGVLYDRHQASVRRFLARLRGARAAELDDLVQATFIEVWRSSPRFRRRSAVKV